MNPSSHHFIIRYPFMTGSGLHCRRLGCRVTAKLHQTINFQILHQCQCVTLTAKSRESDARSLFDLHQKTQLRQLTAGS
ncbi:hypothetical protein FM010_09965 [Salmonella enterica subsp. enterica]|uniref:Uncharacterized protein n=6 Tax=Salmonella enterica TaxID=28901 RepID=A0A5Y1V4S8_SALET|nr:hypothetical protein [Salmonella enterica subsp. enterica]EBH5220586.1 hypothetical protein [Salmonella enterica]EDT7953795.1 hypothetical protein [Salmonella enterica subsp. enterica serovar Java]EBF9781370.1 hypothetical protein [Salmonella enterica subsp. enterica]EBF9913030.1 hypothetical protein [Salmonella enterica subsp. enterica]